MLILQILFLEIASSFHLHNNLYHVWYFEFLYGIMYGIIFFAGETVSPHIILFISLLGIAVRYVSRTKNIDFFLSFLKSI